MQVRTRRKLLISSVAMLLVALLALATATFAWFSTNTTVYANGMSVTADTNANALVIKKYSQNASYYGPTVTTDINANLFPIAHESWGSTTSPAIIETWKMNEGETNNNWYYRYSNSPVSPTGVTNPSASSEVPVMTDKEYIDDTAFSNYVATDTFNVRLNHSTVDETTQKLYVSNINIPANKGIRVILAVAGQKFHEFSAAGTSLASSTATLIDEVTPGTEYDLKAYIYFDGTDSNVYTDNLMSGENINLTGAVDFSLSIEPASTGSGS